MNVSTREGPAGNYAADGGGYIWFGFVGTWTLIGLVMLWIGGAMIGSLAAQAERP